MSNEALIRSVFADVLDTLGAKADTLGLSDDQALGRVFQHLRVSEAFDTLHRRSRVTAIRRSGFKQPDWGYVGLKPPATAMPFGTLFETTFAPLLRGRDRDTGFRCVFEHLAGVERPLIVETGCLRLPGNWGGDGQSTFQWDAIALDRGGDVISIDVNLYSIDAARRACSGRTHLILNDAVIALSSLASLIGDRRVSLLYLDSFDLDPASPLPSAAHHLMELAAARPVLAPGSLVCVDDFAVGEVTVGAKKGGKGLFVDRYMEAVNAEVLHDGYAKVWRMR